MPPIRDNPIKTGTELFDSYAGKIKIKEERMEREWKFSNESETILDLFFLLIAWQATKKYLNNSIRFVLCLQKKRGIQRCVFCTNVKLD